jgi:zinc-ribbon domain
MPPEPEPEAPEMPGEPEPEAAELPPEPEPEAAELPPEPARVAAPVAAPRRPSALPGFTPGASLDDEIAAYDLRVAALSTALPIAAGPPQPAEFEAPAVLASVIAPAASVTRPAAVARPESHLAPMEAIPETPPETASGTPTGTCPSCGLSLSASARFCRRCGTQQHP